MQINQHSTEFKEQALSKARERGSRTLESVATELNLSLSTLKTWLKTARRNQATVAASDGLPSEVPARQWSAPQRLLALQESHALRAEALHAWCREKGLFEHQLNQWREAFCATGPSAGIQGAEHRQVHAELRELQGRHDQLQREMRRKDKALAEAAALLVLQKKFRALWESAQEGEDT